MGVDVIRRRSVAVMVGFGLDRGRDETDLAVGDPAFGNYGAGESPHCAGIATQHREFQAVFMIQMDMQGRDLQLVMGVMRVRQPPRHVPCVVIEHVGQGGDAVAGDIAVEFRLFQAKPGEVADRFGPVVVVMRGHEISQFDGEFVGHADRDPFHFALTFV